MNYNEEEITLYPNQNEKKKKYNSKTQKFTKNNKSYTTALLIFSLSEFIIIIILLIKNFNSNENLKYLNNNNAEIMNNKTDINITNNTDNVEINITILNSELTENKINITIPNSELKEHKINIGRFEYNKDESYNGKTLIHIAMACDNGAVYSTLVSMASALENNNKENNTLVYHLLLSNNFDMNKISYFESLKNDYDFILNYIKIPPFFKYIDKKWRNTETVQYKLLLSFIYPDIPRIIF